MKAVESDNAVLFSNVFSIINLLGLCMAELSQIYAHNFIQIWIRVQIITNMIFVIEILCDIVYKCTSTKKKLRWQFRTGNEFCCQMVHIIALRQYYYEEVGDDFNMSNAVNFFKFIVMLRTLKVLPMLYEIKSMRIIIETMRNMVMPLTGVIALLGAIFYLFSLIGMFLFGGLLRSDSDVITLSNGIPTQYYLLNFNDMLSSYMTLFQLMVINNWFVVVDMYTDLMDSTAYRIYFYMFYYMSVIVSMNIVVAYALDIYGSVEGLDAVREDTLKDMYK